jgi:hypothetical protein
MEDSRCPEVRELKRQLLAAYRRFKNAEMYPALIEAQFSAYSQLMEMNEQMAFHSDNCAVCRHFQLALRESPHSPRKSPSIAGRLEIR